MTESPDEFVEVVSADHPHEAQRRFHEWLVESRLGEEGLSDEDVRIDTIRSRDAGTLRRYRVRNSALPTG